MDRREFKYDEELIIRCAKKAGANIKKVEPGQGGIYMNGKEFNIDEILFNLFPDNNGDKK